MKKDLLCQEDLDHKIWSALPITGCIAFDKSAHLFVDLPVLKVTFSGIQADLSFASNQLR
jgi:hypothetical protein